jgi:hypothetical protein
MNIYNSILARFYSVSSLCQGLLLLFYIIHFLIHCFVQIGHESLLIDLDLISGCIYLLIHLPKRNI